MHTRRIRRANEAGERGSNMEQSSVSVVRIRFISSSSSLSQRNIKVRRLTTVLSDYEGKQYVESDKAASPLNPEEEFFLQQLYELGIREVQPKFTPQGIEFNALSCLTTYYEPKEMIRLLESLTEKGSLEKINYGTVALCPACYSPVFMLTLACPRCGSLKVSKKELVKHLGCGHSGYSEEFVEGIHYRCPSCGAQARIGDSTESSGEQFKVSDSLYECEDCGAVSAKALMSFNCIKCKARFTTKDITYENPCGYRVREREHAPTPMDEPVQQAPIEEPLVDSEPAEPAPEPLEEAQAPEPSVEPSAPAEPENQRILDTPEYEALNEPEERETQEAELQMDAAQTTDGDQEEDEKPSVDAPADEPRPLNVERKPGLFSRLLSRGEAPQPKPEKPVKVEKEVVPRSEANILLIEAHQYRADRILKALEKTHLKSIEVKHAPNGKLGLKELRQPYDAVILDMNLTDVDPDLIVREISRWKVTTPLIVLTDVDTKATIIDRVDLEDIEELEYSEASVRRLPGMIEKIMN